jgi:hypothetical protein
LPRIEIHRYVVGEILGGELPAQPVLETADAKKGERAAGLPRHRSEPHVTPDHVGELANLEQVDAALEAVTGPSWSIGTHRIANALAIWPTITTASMRDSASASFCFGITTISWRASAWPRSHRALGSIGSPQRQQTTPPALTRRIQRLRSFLWTDS